MKIAFFTDVFLPKIDGAIISVINFADELTNLGHEVLIVAPSPKKGIRIHLDNSKIKLLLVPSAPGLVYPELRIGTPSFINLAKKIKEFNPDIIHANTPFTLGINSILIAKILRKPIVGTLHSSIMDKEFLQTFKLKPIESASKFLTKYSNFYFDRCDLVLSPSLYLANRLKSTGLKSPVKVLSNGIKIQNFPVDTNFVKENYSLGSFNLLYVGRLSHEKNISLLIKTMKILKKEIPNLRLIIVGNGPEEKVIKDLVVSLNVVDQIIFVGKMDNAKLLSSGLYQTADLLISASVFEVQPISFLEALSFNLPIIVLKTNGMNEIIKGNGLLVEKNSPKAFAKSVLTLYQDKNLYRKLKENTKKSLYRYDIKNVTRRLLSYYQSVIPKSQPALISNIAKFIEQRFLKKDQA